MNIEASIAAARQLLDQLGITADDLKRRPVVVPTFASYLPTVIAAAGHGARRTYGSYWDASLTNSGTAGSTTSRPPTSKY